VFFTIQKSLPLLRRLNGGSIVINASWTTHRGVGFAPVYAATKAAVHSLARSLGVHLAPEGIRVNSISPGYIRTEMYDGLVTNDAARDATAAVPSGHTGTGEEVAQVCVPCAGGHTGAISAGFRQFSTASLSAWNSASVSVTFAACVFSSR